MLLLGINDYNISHLIYSIDYHDSYMDRVLSTRYLKWKN